MNIIHKNPYREGDSRVLFDYMQKKQIFTRAELMDYMIKDVGKSPRSAKEKVQTLISPRKTSRLGDCRGQYAAQGHLYYCQKLNRKVRYGIRDPQRFQLKWREKPLERRYRHEPVRIKVDGEKSKVETMLSKIKYLDREIQSLKRKVDQQRELVD